MKSTCAFIIAFAAGNIATAAGANDHTPVETSTILPADIIGHIYYNVVTGERIATSFNNDIRPADGSTGGIVWIANNNETCADFPGSTVLLDDPNGSFGKPIEGSLLLDWGDIPSDTVVDCIQLSYFSAIQDVDLDSDSIGDGVEGFAATWFFFDADNGFNSCETRTALMGFIITNLPGQLDGGFGGYFLTIDLETSFGSSIAFEFGDTDSDLQGAAIHNPMINADVDSNGFGDADLDFDGNADFSYVIRYTQPGRVDFDNADGDSDTTTGVDGDPADADYTAVGMVTIKVPSANGAEPGWDIYNNGYNGTFGFDDFICNDGTGDTYNLGQADITMFGPSGTTDCPADFNNDGIVDILDVFAFLAAYNAADPAADLTGDGVVDILDVFAFLASYNAGCP